MYAKYTQHWATAWHIMYMVGSSTTESGAHIRGGTHHPSLVMLVVWVEFIRECPSPDAFSALARAKRIAALYHETLYISMKLRPIVVAAAYSVDEHKQY